jgi:hypothetical protein
MAAREADVGYDQRHHFVAAAGGGSCAGGLLKTADGLVGGEDAFLIVDDTALPKKGRHSAGVAPPVHHPSPAFLRSARPSSISASPPHHTDVHVAGAWLIHNLPK